MNQHTHQLYLLEQHSESFKIWWAIITTNTEGKSLIMKFGAQVSESHIYKYLKLGIWHTCFNWLFYITLQQWRSEIGVPVAVV